MHHTIIILILFMIGCQTRSQLRNVDQSVCSCYQSQTSQSFDEKFSICVSDFVDSNKEEILLNKSNEQSEEEFLINLTLNLMDSLLINCDVAFRDMNRVLNKQYEIKDKDSISHRIAFYTTQLQEGNIDSSSYQLSLLNRSKYFIASKLYQKAIIDLDNIPTNSKFQFDALRTKAYAESHLSLYENAIETYGEIKTLHKGDEQAVRIYITLMKAKLKRSR